MYNVHLLHAMHSWKQQRRNVEQRNMVPALMKLGVQRKSVTGKANFRISGPHTLSLSFNDYILSVCEVILR